MTPESRPTNGVRLVRAGLLAGLFAFLTGSPAPAVEQDSIVERPLAAARAAEWRGRIRSTLFVPDPLPALDAQTHGRFEPAPGVVAERVTYMTQFGLRVPAILYLPKSRSERLPGLIVVNGHGGDKYSWYAFYSGVLYARAGAAVLAYDPLGEGERNARRESGTRAHDKLLEPPEMGRRLGGAMVTDVLQAVSYLAARPEVDSERIAAMGYSMGSFIVALAGAVDERLHACVLVGGGNLDGPDGYWDNSKPMCQGRPYRSLRFLGDRPAAIYALHAARGPTLILNGLADTVVAIPRHGPPFFKDLHERTCRLHGSDAGVFDYRLIDGASHRPFFVTRDAALWLEAQLDFPDWTAADIRAMPTTHIAEWARTARVQMDRLYAAEDREGGTRALGTGVPGLSRADLSVFTAEEWQRHKPRLIYESWVEKARETTIASLKVPEGHPRIFFTRDDLPALRERAGGRYQPASGGDSRKVIRENGFAYVTSGDAAFAERAIREAVRLCEPGLGRDANSDFEDLIDIAICYDWCHAALGIARDTLARTLIEAMETHGYPRRMRRGPGHNMQTENALAAQAAGLALYGEHPRAEQWLRAAYAAVVDEAMTGHLDKFCPDGGDFEGVQYHGARYQGEGIFAWIWLKGTGENLFTADHPHLMNGVNWWIYLLEPHLDGVHVLQGDTNNRGISERNAISAACLSLGAGDPYAGWYASQRLRGWAAIALRPAVMKPPAEGMPPYRFFRMGMAAIRSGWNIGPGSRDTLFTFLCRDYMQGWHCHQDVNHFTISRRGELAIDSGAYAGNSQHMRDYARRTIAHNSMLVYDPAEPLPPNVNTRDGGQVFHHDDEFLKRTGAALLGWRTYDSCDFKAFGVGPGYYYMCGDGTQAYNYQDFRKVELFTREVVYVNEVDPPVVVVFDRVVATKPVSKKTWLLHTIGEPAISGNTATVREQDGQLIVQSLLPKQARLDVVGGPGKEYWVDDPGVNSPPPNGRIWGSWRLEISPSVPTAADVFLTVLYPCDPGSAPPVSELIEQDGRAGCRLSVDGKAWTVLFNARGQNGGTFNGTPLSTADPQQALRPVRTRQENVSNSHTEASPR